MRERPKAVITGASRGIGLEIARAIAPTFELALVASRLESFDTVRDNFDDHVRYFTADFRSLDEIGKLGEELAEDYPTLDLLVNNCGSYLKEPFDASSTAKVESLLSVNVGAVMVLTHRLIPSLKGGRAPLIINVSSIQAKDPSPQQALYAASKGALTTFSTSLRQELSSTGIRVTVLHPGGVNTWNGPEKLLLPKDIGSLVLSVLTLAPHVHIEEITLSAIERNS